MVDVGQDVPMSPDTRMSRGDLYAEGRMAAQYAPQKATEGLIRVANKRIRIRRYHRSDISQSGLRATLALRSQALLPVSLSGINLT